MPKIEGEPAGKLAVLEAENQFLAERAEDIMLLGLISEAVSEQEDLEELVNSVIEKISILKNVPYVAYCRIDGNKILPIYSYCSFTDKEPAPAGFVVKDLAGAGLSKTGKFVCGSDDFSSGDSLETYWSPSTLAVVAASFNGPGGHALVLADDEKAQDEFARMLPLVERVAYVVATHIQLLTVMKELKAVNAQLDERVKKRTQDLELANTMLQEEMAARVSAEQDTRRYELRLAQSQKMEALGTLAGGIAHDFNNLLAAIVGYGELATIELTRDSGASKHVGMMLKAAERAKELVRQILTFSRKAEAQRKKIDLGMVLRDALDLVRVSIPSSVKVFAETIEDGVTVFADPTQLHQVLLNLCTNAFHAMKDGGGTLTVELTKIHRPDLDEDGLAPPIEGDFCRLRFIDNGPGIAPEVLNRIFEPFFTTKGLGEGTGMGLSVVHGVVKAHGGEIRVKSSQGAGSSFVIYLPCYQGTAENEDEVSQPTMGGDQLVMVVDDEPMLAELNAKLLETLGYRAVFFVAPLEALKWFKKWHDTVSLVVTDQSMPLMTGLELAKEIKTINPDMPVAVCSGYTETIDESSARNKGADAFILKPFHRKELAKTVENLLRELPLSRTCLIK